MNLSRTPTSAKAPFAITLPVGSSLVNKTGAWRTERPQYVDRMPACNDACPAGENIQEWLARAEEGGYEAAWRRIVDDNPFPAVMGRVCYHPCQTACNRAQLDEAVGIHAVERFLGDEAIRRGWELPAPGQPTGRRILVVGGGPAGLSAAYHLRRAGHEVEIHDGAEALGGMLRFGIPRYRLPRAVLDAELDRLLALGIGVSVGSRVGDLESAMQEGGFDAAFLGVGAGLAANAYVPAADSARILDALTLLAATEGGEPPALGRRVVIYGGGDTAVDAARTARRLGATDAVIVYRRTRQRMPAHAEEVAAAESEGVRMRWLSTIARADAGEIVIEEMVLDDTGFPQPTGAFSPLGADAVVLALGERADLSLVERLDGVDSSGGVIGVGEDRATGHPGVFAGGDAVVGERTVTTAIGHGKAAARGISTWLEGGRYTRYRIDYDYCKGCGLCAAECPCGAIEMIPEPS